MKKYKTCIGWLLLVAMIVGTLSNSVYFHANEYEMDVFYEQDKSLIDSYIESVNNKDWMKLPDLFCEEQEEVLFAFLKEKGNESNNEGIYNVTHINDYMIYKTENYVEEEYGDFSNVVEYLLYLDCTVNESTLFFKEDDNYFRLVIGTETTSRKILELSVASDTFLEDSIESDSVGIPVAVFTEYRDERLELLNTMDDFDTIVVQENAICDNGLSILASDDPKTISSYLFPTTIKILKTTDNQIYSRNFKNYCYVVCASEFSCGTDGAVTPHTEALKAFALCVRNVGWYRALYPYNATAGYNVTDSSQNCQNYLWSIENSVATSYPRQVSAMNNIWNVMMFDCQKKLFYPSYRSGSYNGNKRSDLSVLYQNGSNYLATVLGYNYKQILHYYYDNAVGGQITPGTIIICDSHTQEAKYTKTLYGHGRKCMTCGYIILTSHNWQYVNNRHKCSTCGYETTSLPPSTS